MALVKQAWTVEITLIDKGSNETTRSYPLVATDDAGDVSALVTEVTGTIIPALLAVTLLVIKKWTLRLLYLETSLSLPTDSGAEVEAHALITVPIYGIPNKSAVVDIPGPEILCFVGTSGPNYNIVDTSGDEVRAYVGLFKQVGNVAYISDGEQLDNVDGRGRRTHSRSQRG
jgi:hypothetical protein